MTISSTPLDIILSVLISIITGIITGYIVTKYYRCKDKDRDSVLYLQELDHCLIGLNEVLFSKKIEINDEDIYKLLNFFSKTRIPNRYKWIKFSKEDLTEVEKIENYIKSLQWSVLQCHLNMMRADKTDEEKRKLEIWKTDIIIKARIDYLQYTESVSSLISKYLNLKATKSQHKD